MGGKPSLLWLLKLVWETWNIRGLVVISLLIQTCLTLVAPTRKRSAGACLRFWLWLLYLCADVVAVFTLGKISTVVSGNAPIPKEAAAQNHDLITFWATFLVLHLGGPDTITALALEDNELWLRHALQLATQVIVTVFVLVRSLAHGNTHLLLPTLLIFLDGFIKYGERTFALYHSSADNFRDSLRPEPEPGPNHARLLEEHNSANNAGIPVRFEGLKDPNPLESYEIQKPKDSRQHDQTNNHNRQQGQGSSVQDNAAWPAGWYREDYEMIRVAYHFYQKFKGILADQFLSLMDSQESCSYISDKPSFRILEIELNLIYDVFYTKAVLLLKNNRYFRVLSFLSAVASLSLFSMKDKTEYPLIDVAITFALLIGALALDLVAIIMFLVSDWPVILFLTGKSKPSGTRLQKLLRYCCRKNPSKRWSESISEYNLLRRCYNDLPSVINRHCMRQFKDFLIGLFYVHQRAADKGIGDFIMKEVLNKAPNAALGTDVEGWIEKVCSARGDLVFQDEYVLVSQYLRPWTLDMDYDGSLLTWHLATDFCYRTSSDAVQETCSCKVSKYLSDYMSYLMLRQRALISPVMGMSDVRFDDTCEDVKKNSCFKSGSWFNFLYKKLKLKSAQDEKDILKYCENVLKQYEIPPPITPKDYKSKSVFHEACCLAQQLKMLGEKQWDITAKVWVEMLCYAAIRCSPRSHIAVLNRGGELITLVWLLMIHLGLSTRFRKDRGLAWWIKLTISK